MSEAVEVAGSQDDDTAIEKVTVRLAARALRNVRIGAAEKGVSLNEFARQALGTEVYLLEQKRKGARILIERPDKTLSELVLI